MLIINLQNVKDLIISDKKATSLLSEFQHFFDTWKFSVRFPTFRSLGEKALIDFLLSLKPEHIKILEQYFGQPISVDTMDYRIVKNIKMSLNEEGNLLDGFPNFSIYRNSDNLYITNWR